MSVETLLVGGAIKVGAFAYNRAMIHCKHCKGNGPCECAFGCTVKKSNKCFAFFKDRTCASCRQKGIKGSLYQCRECKNLDLCSTCYEQRVHPDHDFIEFKRRGAEPVFHQAQSKPVLATVTHMPPTSRPGAPAQPAPAAMHMSAPNIQCAPIYVPPLPVQSIHSSLVGHPSSHSVPPQSMHTSFSGHSSSHSSSHSTITRVSCDLCRRDGNRISHHKCASCPNFDLCETCHATGFHGHHAFYAYKDEYSQPILLPAANVPIVHSRVVCDHCGTENIQGSRYKCAVCPEFDLCQTCYGQSAHAHHAFVKYARPKDRSPIYLPAKDDPHKETAPRLPIHVQVTCDGCHRDGIVGSRYKCSICQPSFDLCSKCWTDGKHGTHTFWHYPTPHAQPSLQPAKTGRSASQATVRAVHTNVVCDGCGVGSIQGPRYSCQSCQDVDLCERCYTKNKHSPRHGFLRYEKPGSMPLFIEPERAPLHHGASGAPEEGGGGGGGGAAGWFNQLGDNLIEGAIEDSVDDLAQDFGQALGGMFGFGDDDEGCDC